MTQADVATAIGVSPQAVSKYEALERMPRPTVLARIQRWSGGAVTAADFLPADVAVPSGNGAAIRNPLVSWGWVAGIGWSFDTVKLPLGEISHAGPNSKSERMP